MSNNLAHAVKSEDKELKVLALSVNLSAAAAVTSVVANANLFSIVKNTAGKYTITLKNKYLGTPRIFASLQVTGAAAIAFNTQVGAYVANLGAAAPSTLEVYTVSAAGAGSDVTAACVLHIMLVFKDGISA